MTSIIQRISGIYQWRQLSTGRKYYGSTVDLKRRPRDHVKELTEQRHKNKHFQNAWNKYGSNDFAFEVVEIVKDKAQLIEREQWYLDHIVVWGFQYSKKGRLATRTQRRLET